MLLLNCWHQLKNKMAQIFPLEVLTNTVLNLRQKVSSGNYSVGTGSFISKGNKLFIVTAEHVANDMKTDMEVILKGKNDLPITLSLEDLTQQNTSLDWVKHNDADIAVLEVNPKQDILNTSLQNRFLPSESVNKVKTAVDRNIQLTVIGFPMGLGAQGHFSPLTFRTFASSGLLTLPRFDNKKPCTFIVLENPGVGGYSGGPVIDLSIYQNMGMQMTGNGTMIHGFLHGTISDQTGGKLAAVTPSYYLFDLI